MSTSTPPPAGLENLHEQYRSGVDALDKDFFQPCLAHCTSYDRAVGYFTSHALAAWAHAVPRFLQEPDVVVRLVVGPVLLPEDKAALRELTDPEKRSLYQQTKADLLIDEAIQLLSDSSDAARISLFCWLVANNKIQIRIAFPAHVPNPETYHEKFGIFTFPNSSKAAFTGSANETAGGYRQNYEYIDVFRSWIPEDAARVNTKVLEFNRTWDGQAAGLLVRPPSPHVLERIRDLSRNTPRSTATRPQPTWAHQDRAIEEFMIHKHGILEMATGTGKTRTALRIATALLEAREISGLIVTTSGNDLLDQWSSEIRQTSILQDLVLYQHYADHHDIGYFTLHPSGSILLCSRLALTHLRPLLADSAKPLLLVIHDEVHGFGSPAMQRELAGFHRGFAGVLGLSATPEREYDEAGNNFLDFEIGPILFQYALQDAIQDGILSPFRYVNIPYELTDNDRYRLHQVFARSEAAAKAGHPWQEDQIYRELSLVYKTAEEKPKLFKDYICNNADSLHSTIVFVETHQFGMFLLDAIGTITTAYSTYFDDDPPDRLQELSNRELDCLVCCKRLSQGIDIRHLRNVILVSSDRGRLQTIQRIGRTLRTDPDDPLKVATVVDFVLHDAPDNHADRERSEWLGWLSRIRPRTWSRQEEAGKK